MSNDTPSPQRTRTMNRRFKLMFSANEDADDGNNVPFAYYSNGEIIVFADACNASLQVIDVMGRVVRTVGLSQCGSRTTTTEMAPGVYILRLINGDNVKTQKNNYPINTPIKEIQNTIFLFLRL